MTRHDYIASRVEELFNEVSILRDQLQMLPPEEPPINGEQLEMPVEDAHVDSVDMADEIPVHQEPPPELEIQEHPHPLDIAMPIQEGRYLPQAVLASIELQACPYRLWLSTRFSSGETAAMRQNVMDMALRGPSEFVLATDNDLVFSDGDFQAMVEFLIANPDFAGIAISKGAEKNPDDPGGVSEDPHVDAGPVMFRKSAFTNDHQDPETGQFERLAYSNKSGCECQSLCNDIRRLGMRIGFLNGRRVHHMHNTTLG